MVGVLRLRVHHASVAVSRLALVLLIAASARAQQQAAAAGRDLLRNGDFSQGQGARPKFWVYYFGAGSQALGTFVLQPGEEGTQERILSIELKGASPQPWNVQFRQGIWAPLKAGERLQFRFQYKLSAGYTCNWYWQKEAPPFPKFFDGKLSGKPDVWQECIQEITVPEDLPARRSSLSFHLATGAGTAQFRRFAVTVIQDGTPAETAPEPQEQARKPGWFPGIQERLKQTRTSELKVTVTRNGAPVANVPLRITQMTRDFLFGATAPPALLDDNASLPPDLAKATANAGKELGAYRDMLLNPRLFSALLPTKTVGWGDAESGDDKAIARAFALLRERKIAVHGHALFTPSFRFAPSGLRHRPVDALSEALETFVTQQVSRYKDTVSRWTVVNAPLTYQEIYDRIGEACMVRTVVLARKANPDARLYIGDDTSLTAPTPDHAQEFAAFIGWLAEEGANVDGLALQARIEGTTPVSPQVIDERLTQLHAATKLPITISSLSIESDDDAGQARQLQVLLTVLFSHPAVEAVYLDDLWEPIAARPQASLLLRNLAPRPSGKRFSKLVGNTWWTRVTGETGADGTLSIQGYHGVYSVVAKTAGGKESKQVTLGRDGSQVALTLD